MKYYGVFKDGKRIKRHGLHRTEDKALSKWFSDTDGASIYIPLTARLQAKSNGYQIKVTAETE